MTWWNFLSRSEHLLIVILDLASMNADQEKNWTWVGTHVGPEWNLSKTIAEPSKTWAEPEPNPSRTQVRQLDHINALS